MRPFIHMVRAARALMLAGAVLSALHAVAHANTVCNNGQCITCDGPIVCVNSACTCNGVPVTGGGNATVQPQGRCGGEPTIAHPNGGGTISTNASVAPSVFVSVDSTVCGHATVSGATRLERGSTVNGSARVSDSQLASSTVNGSARVSDSQLTSSTVNSSARVVNARLVNSTANGSASVSDSTLANSVVNGGASITGRQLQNAVINR